MLYKDEKDFSAAFKEGAPRGVYLLFGSEDYLIASWRKKILHGAAGEEKNFSLQVLDWKKTDSNTLYDTVETLPMTSSRKAVVLEDFSSKQAAAESENLLEIISDIPDFCVLIIIAKAENFDEKSAIGKKIIAACGKYGSAVPLVSRGETGLGEFIRRRAKQNGCEMNSTVSKYILRLCEHDMMSLDKEIEKICAYAASGTITNAHVDAVCIPKTEARVFDLAKSILAGNTRRALEILRDLFYLREAPVMILSALSTTYIDLYRAKTAKSSGKTPADMISLMGYSGKEFRVKNAFEGKLSEDVLRHSVAALLDCDRKLKSGAADEQVLLEQTVIRLFALQNA